MSILGSLIVNLTANTAAFVDGMSGAAKTAKTTGREIESAFSGLGDAISKALGGFGEIGSVVGGALNSVGGSVNTAVNSLGAMGVSFGTLGTIGIAAAGALAVVDIAAFTLALHAAEGAAKLHELSQATGISVEALSGLGFVGKQVGLDTQTMATGLERLSKSAFAAATAPTGTINAYTRLGISVRDTQGHIRGVQDIFLDVSDKFSKMENGAVKTALAMQLFGRGGAALIPILNQGRDGVQGFVETAERLGLVISDQTAAAAQKLEQNLGLLSATAEGFGNRLLADMLPSLLAVTNALSRFLQAASTQEALGHIISLFGTIAKWSVYAGETLFKLLDVLTAFVERAEEYVLGFGGSIITAMQAVWKATTGDFAGAEAKLQAGLNLLSAPVQGFINDTKKSWSEYVNFIHSMSAPVPAARTGPSGSAANTAPSEHNTALERIIQRIAALKQETLDWASVGAAGSQAEALIAEATRKGNEEFNKLKVEAAKDKTGKAVSLVLNNEDLIKGKAAAEVYGTAIKQLTIDLDKQAGKFSEQDKAALSLASAYSQGGAAIANAALGKQFADEAAKLGSLSAAHDLQAARLGNENQQVRQLAQGVAALTSMLRENEAVARRVASDELSADLQKQLYNFNALNPLVTALSGAYLQNESAVRHARIELELYKFQLDQQEKGIVATSVQIEAKRKLLEQADRQAYEGSLAQEAAQFSLSAIYDQQVVKLSRIREIVQQYGQSTLLVDAALYDAQTRMVQQWDQAAIKMGNFALKTKAVFNELLLQGREAGAKIAEAFLSAFDGAETELARLLVTGKGNFQAVLQSLEESIVKAGIQKAVGGLLGSFGLKLPGFGAQLGTEQNPMWVRLKGGLEGALALPTAASTQTGIGSGQNLGGVQGGGIGTVVGAETNTGEFVQGLSAMSDAQSVFAAGVSGSWARIASTSVAFIQRMVLAHAAGEAGKMAAHTASEIGQTATTNAHESQRSAIGHLYTFAHIARSLKRMIAHTLGEIGATAATIGHTAIRTAVEIAHTAGHIFRSFARMLAHVFSEIFMTSITIVNIGIRLAAELAAQIKSVMSSAYRAAAHVFAAVMMALPFPWNIVLAPVAAAATFAATMAVGGAERGALLGSDMPIFAHKKEMILPAGISEGLQDIIKAGRTAPSVPSVSQFTGTKGTGGGDHFHTHIHQGNITALDSVGVAEQLKKAKGQLIKETRRMFQTGHLDPRKLARI